MSIQIELNNKIDSKKISMLYITEIYYIKPINQNKNYGKQVK